MAARPSSSWTYFAGDAPEADPIERPSRKVKAAARKGGFTHDAGAGTFLGRSVAEHGAFPVGSLVFRAADGGKFWMTAAVEAAPESAAPTPAPKVAASAVEKPKRARKPKAEPAVDAAKDKALLDAFSAAIASVMQQA